MVGRQAGGQEKGNPRPIYPWQRGWLGTQAGRAAQKDGCKAETTEDTREGREQLPSQVPRPKPGARHRKWERDSVAGHGSGTDSCSRPCPPGLSAEHCEFLGVSWLQGGTGMGSAWKDGALCWTAPELLHRRLWPPCSEIPLDPLLCPACDRRGLGQGSRSWVLQSFREAAGGEPTVTRHSVLLRPKQLYSHLPGGFPAF